MIGDTFEPLETWHDKETKRVGRSLTRHHILDEARGNDCIQNIVETNP